MYTMSVVDDIKVLVRDKKTDSSATESKNPKKKLLIVEDDDYLRDFYTELLSGEGYEVITAKNGQLGYDLTLLQKPDLIILDLMMPVMSGKTMLHNLRKIGEFRWLPIIILTNAGDIDSMRDTQEYENANRFLIKSNVSPEQIISEVKSLI